MPVQMTGSGQPPQGGTDLPVTTTGGATVTTTTTSGGQRVSTGGVTEGGPTTTTVQDTVETGDTPGIAVSPGTAITSPVSPGTAVAPPDSPTLNLPTFTTFAGQGHAVQPNPFCQPSMIAILAPMLAQMAHIMGLSIMANASVERNMMLLITSTAQAKAACDIAAGTAQADALTAQHDQYEQQAGMSFAQMGSTVLTTSMEAGAQKWDEIQLNKKYMTSDPTGAPPLDQNTQTDLLPRYGSPPSGVTPPTNPDAELNNYDVATPGGAKNYARQIAGLEESDIRNGRVASATSPGSLSQFYSSKPYSSDGGNGQNIPYARPGSTINGLAFRQDGDEGYDASHDISKSDARSNYTKEQAALHTTGTAHFIQQAGQVIQQGLQAGQQMAQAASYGRQATDTATAAQAKAIADQLQAYMGIFQQTMQSMEQAGQGCAQVVNQLAQTVQQMSSQSSAA